MSVSGPIRAIGRHTGDRDEDLRRLERSTFYAVVEALVELSEISLDDDVGLVRGRRRYLVARGFWSDALRALDIRNGPDVG